MFDDTTPLVEGLSIDEAFLDVRGLEHIREHPPRSRSGCGATSASTSDCRSRSGWRGRSSSRRWRAAWPSPTGCWSCRPTASWPFSTRSRSSGSGASARPPPASSTGAGSGPSGRSRRSPRRRSCSMLGRASGRHLHALAHNLRSAAGGGRPPAGLDRVAARTRTPHAEDLGRRRRRPDRARRPRHPPDAGRRACRPHRRPAAAIRRLLARDAVAHAAAGDLPHADHPRHGRDGSWRRRCR